MPNIEVQRRALDSFLYSSIANECFLVSIKWWQQFLNYIQFEHPNTKSSSVPNEEFNPGPIDNLDLM